MKKVLLGFLLVMTGVNQAMAGDAKDALNHLENEKQRILIQKAEFRRGQDEVLSQLEKGKISTYEAHHSILRVQSWIAGLSLQMEEIAHLRTQLIDAIDFVTFAKKEPSSEYKTGMIEDGKVMKYRASVDALNFKAITTPSNINKVYPLSPEEVQHDYITDVNRQVARAAQAR